MRHDRIDIIGYPLLLLRGFRNKLIDNGCYENISYKLVGAGRSLPPPIWINGGPPRDSIPRNISCSLKGPA